MRKWTLFALVTGLALIVSSAQAVGPSTVEVDFYYGNILAGTASIGGGGWTVQKDGDPWWDNFSADPSGRNIGDVLSSAGDLPSPPGALDYLYGTNTATSVADWVFRDSIGSGVLRLELAGWANINQLGIYKAGSTSPSDRITLFSGPDSPSKQVTFSIPASWGGRFGLFITSQVGTFYSEASLNPSDTQPDPNDPHKNRPYQHFALFKGGFNQYGFVRWWIGVEDKNWAINGPGQGNEHNNNNSNRGDYQDMVLTIEAVPDASTLALFLSG
ncbi:MAG: hypothetical protein RMK92_05425, partial [Armatimonadota bacterium]|nr:hypothetical protein [Armatimonadota bacterium]